MSKVKQIIINLREDIESSEREYVIECLKSAVAYCKSQYQDSGVDWLPTVNFVGLHDEADKFELCRLFLEML